MRRWGAAGAWLVGCVVASPAARAADGGAGGAPAGAIAAESVVRTIDEFWHLSPERRARPVAYELECDVLYYDAEWGALWFQDATGPTFGLTGAAPLPIRTGQRVRLRGVSPPPNAELSVVGARCETLGEARVAATPVGTRLGQANLFTNRFVEVEGLVDQQARHDATHWSVVLACGARPVQVWVLAAPGAEMPDFRGQTVRVRGVYNPKLTPSGTLAALELMVAGPDRIEAGQRLEQDPRFAAAAIPVAQLAGQPASRRVRVAGEVVGQEPGRFLRLRDATGQVEVQSAQTHTFPLHAAVEAVGYPVLRRNEWVLEDGVFRARQPDSSAAAAGAAADEASDELPVTTIQEFWALPPERRARPQRYELEVQVLYYDAQWKQLWVADRTAGVYVAVGDRGYPVKAGQRLLVSGRLAPPIGDLNFAEAAFRPLPAGEPPPVTPLGDWSRYESSLLNRLVSVEGLIDRQTFGDHHLRLFLSVGGRAMYAWIPLPPGAPYPDFSGSLVRVTGIYNPKFTADGAMTSLELMVPGLDHVVVRGPLASDPRFDRPAVAIDQLRALAGDRTLVRIAGEVQGQQAGRSLLVRDGSGQVEVLAAQMLPLAMHAPVEAIGRVERHGADVRLVDATYRPAGDGGAPAPPAKNAELRLVAQILELAPDDAKRGQPVFLTGVVTWSQLDAPFFYLQDGTGGVRVWRGADPNLVRSTGRNIEVRGTAAMGPFAPEVRALEVTKIGDLAPPDAPLVLLEHALTGVEESQWVEMRGFLRAVQDQRDEHGRVEQVLHMATPAGDFEALVPAGEPVAQYVGSVLALRGVCTARLADDGRLAGVRLRVPPDVVKWIRVEEPAPEDVFSVPRRSIASLGRFATTRAFNRRVKVEGTVLLAAAGRLVLDEGGDSVVALTRAAHGWKPGDRLEAVGFLGRQGARVVLRETVFRRLGPGVVPTPLDMNEHAAVSASTDGRLVRLTGQLLDTNREGDALRLTVQGGSAVFTAVLEPAAAFVDAPFTDRGARLALTGVYDVRFDEYGAARGFSLLLRGPEDVRVVARPSWFTPARLVTFTATLGLGTAGIIGWVVALRRRVRRQTAQIRLQVEREHHLQGELERALRLESLGVLAGGIAHDFNNLLTVVMGNVSLARLDAGIDPDTEQSLGEAERAVARARDLTQQLLTFSKGGAPIRAAVMLSDVVREVAQFVLRGSSVSAEFAIAPDLWPADVDKGQVAQVVQNIVINAAQAMPDGGRLEIALANTTIAEGGSMVLTPGRYLKLAVTDHGRGIKAEDLPRIFDPYFTTKKQGSGLGLATVYSIVKKHGGHIGVESKLGVGTTFTIFLPAAAAAPAEPEKPPVETAPDVAAAPAGSKGRVLVMDDEESIRRLSATLLRRAGFDVATAKDGAEAVLEYGAAFASGRRYDLVVFDLTVPGGMGGRAALEELRKIDPAVKAIVSSGYSNDPTLADHRAAGFDAMVSKPYEIATFVRTVETLCARENGAR